MTWRRRHVIARDESREILSSARRRRKHERATTTNPKAPSLTRSAPSSGSPALERVGSGMLTACFYHDGVERRLSQAIRAFGSGRCLDLPAIKESTPSVPMLMPTYPRISNPASWCLGLPRCHDAYSIPRIPAAQASCGTRPPPRVAVILAGTPRTFLRPHVHRSIRSNLIGGLQTRADVFAVFGLREPPAKAGWRAVPRHAFQATRRELAQALAAVDPRAIALDEQPVESLNEKTSATSAYGERLNPLCSTSAGFMGQDSHHQRGEHALRVIAQPASWGVGWRLVELAERRDGGRRYHWVVRTRPDAWWFARHPAACALRLPTIYLNDVVDMHFVLPRAIAAKIMVGMSNEYRSCRGRFAHDHGALETWLRDVVHANAVQPTGAIAGGVRVTQVLFPFALVRHDSNQTLAWWQCGRLLGAYGAHSFSAAASRGGDGGGGSMSSTVARPPFDEASSSLGGTCGEMRRGLLARLLACVRGAFPEESFREGYRAAEVEHWVFNRSALSRQEGWDREKEARCSGVKRLRPSK